MLKLLVLVIAKSAQAKQEVEIEEFLTFSFNVCAALYNAFQIDTSKFGSIRASLQLYFQLADYPCQQPPFVIPEIAFDIIIAKYTPREPLNQLRSLHSTKGNVGQEFCKVRSFSQ